MNKKLKRQGFAVITAMMLASPAMAMTPQEKAFLSPDGLADREATIVPMEQQVKSESWITHQGGNTGKPCDTPEIPANVMTQVSSDNAFNNGNGGGWQQSGGGFVSLVNNGNAPAACTADFFYGDQTALGPDLNLYYHTNPVQWKKIGGSSGDQINWKLFNLAPLQGNTENDAMAYFLFVTCSRPVSCTYNGYDTTESGNGN